MSESETTYLESLALYINKGTSVTMNDNLAFKSHRY